MWELGSVDRKYVHIMMLYANINIYNLLNALLFWLPLEKWLIRVDCITFFYFCM